MKISEIMCHSHLVSMLLQPELFENAIISYTSSSPEVSMEGMNGYMEIKVEFNVRDLEKFSILYHKSRVYPSERSKWYYKVKSGVLGCMGEC